MKNEFWLLFQILISTRLCWLCPSPECLFVYVMWHVKMLFNDLWKWVELQSSIKRWVIFQQTCFLSIIGSHTFHIPLQELHTLPWEYTDGSKTLYTQLIKHCINHLDCQSSGRSRGGSVPQFETFHMLS